MYFHNKSFWSHKCEHYLLETWLNVKYFNWHVTHSYILLGTELVYGNIYTVLIIYLFRLGRCFFSAERAVLTAIDLQVTSFTNQCDACMVSRTLFRSSPNSKFFHSFFITSIFSRLHGALNVGKKITNCTV